MNGKRRLLTRCDIDGMVSGMMLRELELVDRINYCHPHEVESGSIPLSGDDITAGLPYRETVHLAFDCFFVPGRGKSCPNLITDHHLPSTARVIANHFGRDQFASIPRELQTAVDQWISADVTIDDILYPAGWFLLIYLTDRRTGLDRYVQLSLPTTTLFENLLDWCRDYTVWEILDFPEIAERLDQYFAATERFKAQIMRCATLHNNLVVVDLRREEVVFPGNRYMIYALFPECNVSLQIMRHPAAARTLFAAGKSFIDRSFAGDIGCLMKSFGGRGHHRRAGFCEVPDRDADRVVEALVRALKYGPVKNLIMGYYP